jgi:hypothetical protein
LPTVGRASRQAGLRAAIAGALVLTLAGCGGSGSGTSETSASHTNRARTTDRHKVDPSTEHRTVPALIPPPGAPERSVRVPVLTYHRVAPLSAVGLTDLKVDPANFVAELAALKQNGYHPIRQAQLFDALYKGTPLPSTAAELRAETAGSREMLERVLGHHVYFFAYPFGAYNDTVIAAVRAAGFSMAYTTDSGDTESSASPLTMPRLHVGRSETPGGLVSELGGA